MVVNRFATWQTAAIGDANCINIAMRIASPVKSPAKL
jgi:hypothetical protein